MASHKRRYRCSECRWTGWRHRLHRTHGPALADQIFNAHEVRSNEVWYFVVVTVAFVLFLGIVMKQCADEAPPPPADISWLLETMDPATPVTTNPKSLIPNTDREIRPVSRLPRR
jgi:hypothetical protein